MGLETPIPNPISHIPSHIPNPIPFIPFLRHSHVTLHRIPKKEILLPENFGKSQILVTQVSKKGKFSDDHLFWPELRNYDFNWDLGFGVGWDWDGMGVPSHLNGRQV
jgi:hypothetical protein